MSKLVRDNIPQIIHATGVKPIIRFAKADEYRGLLHTKLVEEVNELVESDDPGELADVLEVLLTLAVDLGVNEEQLEDLRMAKTAERGGFTKRIVWEGNTTLVEDRRP